ncbi:MAG: hydrogenase nickel incorporation protein HybF [Alphaproteobacteria bacterium ADurb.BinA280]|jgi:hydrogenase nickel incorporation protein HypA/HybF|nr:hydrogenase maturation nickel metallochaperone HypA [Xanthomonadales bacterium]MCC6503963.1 hydrogenase maturation nickel metallochaperone HypA [Aquimonas sp.]OPZ11446.1 MAG: hydrogenase nickel incorporation protein HybF [Alphaproteobacteria bacterium ADurb.BinA280]
MHEMSLAEGMREIVVEQAQRHGFSHVRILRVEIGRFAGVEKDALAFCFDVVMRGSPAESAVLEMIDLPGRAQCFDCLQEVDIVDRLDPCPLCGGNRLLPVGGDEMRIKDMEVS